MLLVIARSICKANQKSFVAGSVHIHHIPAFEHGGVFQVLQCLVIYSEQIAVWHSCEFEIQLFAVEGQVVKCADVDLCEGGLLSFHLGEETVAVEFSGMVSEEYADK